MSTLTKYAVKRPRISYSERGQSIQGSPIDASLSILAAVSRPVISFAMGSPAPDAMPTETITELAGELLSGSNAAAALDYTPSEGDPGLRETLAYRLAKQGLPVSGANLLITSGGMQGLDLVSKLFVDPGDVVVVESPSYPNGLATLQNYGAELLHAPLDEDGLDVDRLEHRLADVSRTPRLIYTIPTFQNPSGLSTTIDRRLALLDVARRVNALIVEDDPYSELRYVGDPIPSLLELDNGDGRVIQVRTFSKILTPGLRVGWVIGPRDTIDRMVRAKQSMDTCANSIGQGLARLMIEKGHLDAHVAELRSIYPSRRDAMIEELTQAIPADSGVTWSNPSGGMFLWLRLPEGMSGNGLARACLDRDVAVVPGSAFTLKQDESAVRLCFAAVPEGAIRRGIAGFASAMSDMLRSISTTARSGM